MRIVKKLASIYIIVHVKLLYFVMGVICRHLFAILPSIKNFGATKYLHPRWNKNLKLKAAHPKDSKSKNNISRPQSSRKPNNAKTFDGLSDIASLFNEENESN